MKQPKPILVKYEINKRKSHLRKNENSLLFVGQKIFDTGFKKGELECLKFLKRLRNMNLYNDGVLTVSITPAQNSSHYGK